MADHRSPLFMLPAEIWTKIGTSPSTPAEAFLTQQSLRHTCRDLARTMPPLTRPPYSNSDTFNAYARLTKHASWPLLLWLHEQNALHIGMYFGAAKAKRFDVIQWLAELGCPVNLRVLNCCQRGGRAPMDDWLYERSQLLQRARIYVEPVRFAPDGSVAEIVENDPW